MHKKIKVVCFDADDTLWINEPYYREAEKVFTDLLKEYSDSETSDAELLKTEIANIPLYGYGIKSFTLSMLETAIKLSNRKITIQKIEQIINLGRTLLNKPLELNKDVEDVLKILQKDFRLIVATKGDLLDQEKKLKNSGLEKYFHHIEIMSEKYPGNYKKLIKHLDIAAAEFLMIGNSMKSDILPVLEIGGYAIHIPCDTTWIHENAENHHIQNPSFKEVASFSSLPEVLKEFI